MAGTTKAFLESIGSPDLPAATSPFDPGYDPVTLTSHLAQSRHLISILKLSMACWLLADEGATRAKVGAAHAQAVPTTAGGGPFEIAVAQGRLPEYLDVCAAIGFDRIECGEGFTDSDLSPPAVVAMARERGLEVQFELGKKQGGGFAEATVTELLDQGYEWLAAGAAELVVEGRESAKDVGLFDANGRLDVSFAERFADAFGLDRLTFEAPTKASQFALLDHFGPAVQLSNVRLEELLRVEIYRRGLHSDAFGRPNLRPRRPTPATPAASS
jgi:phosphosulfolactate synthase